MSQAALNINTLNVYQARHPQAGGYYKCVEPHFEELERIWDDRYASRFGFWRDYVTKVIRRYLECGDLLSVRPATTVEIEQMRMECYPGMP